VSELQKISYAFPAGPITREPSTQLKREVGDGARDVLGVTPVDAEPEPVGDGLLGSFVTKMTEIKFELPGLAICPSLLK
jgi:hypothetical protein